MKNEINLHKSLLQIFLSTVTIINWSFSFFFRIIVYCIFLSVVIFPFQERGQDTVVQVDISVSRNNVILLEDQQHLTLVDDREISRMRVQKYQLFQESRSHIENKNKTIYSLREMYKIWNLITNLLSGWFYFLMFTSFFDGNFIFYF